MQSQIEKVRDKGRQLDMMGVPEANLDGHAFHTYRYPCLLAGAKHHALG